MLIEMTKVISLALECGQCRGRGLTDNEYTYYTNEYTHLSVGAAFIWAGSPPL